MSISAIFGADLGISVVRAAYVRLQRVNISGFTAGGVVTRGGRLGVVDSDIHDNDGAGIILRPAANTIARATIRRSDLDDNGGGVLADASSGGLPIAHPTRSAVTDSGQGSTGDGVGLYAKGARATIRMSGSEIQADKVGLKTSNGGQILSAGDNDVIGNVINGSRTGTWQKQ